VFLGMRQEDYRAVSTVLAQTREIPADCQWGIFLRNGDEMSLDLVTPDEREYLKREFAPLARMRNDRGIRRRLASLHDGKQEKLSLCIALLLSLPGAPVLYYGDEIGMGENLSLPGCAAIRTPMQWSSDRSGGFSTAEHEQLALPVVLDSVYGYQSTNVEAQLRNSTSLLRNTKRLIEIRRHSAALTTGSFAEIRSGNVAVWAYVRSFDAEQILCVVNFSNYPQAAELNLADYAGKWPVEITGGARFPVIGAGSYQVSLAGNGFYWLRLVKHKDAVPLDGSPTPDGRP
jgi:maltose alpha-D-glucosyltransferase/alpha-amylase